MEFFLTLWFALTIIGLGLGMFENPSNYGRTWAEWRTWAPSMRVFMLAIISFILMWVTLWIT